MQKINFSNLPSTTTPINATNLNQLQTNVDNAKVETEADRVDNVDANNYLKSGFYYLGTGCSNVPQTYLRLIVCGSSTSPQVTQVGFSTVSNRVYTRHKADSIWTDWVDITTNTNIAITANVDFDTLITQGNYFEGSTPTGNNKPPVNAAGLLEVFVQSSFIIQRYTPYTADKFLIRGKYSTNAWSSWKSVTLS